MEWFILFSVLLIVLIIWWKNAEKKRTELLKQTLFEEAKSYTKKIFDAKALEHIQTSIILKNDEIAFLECKTTLLETKSVRYFQSGSVGYRLTKRIYLGSRSGTSHNQDELKHIDTGTLTLTNKRLVFTGLTNSRNIQISKLIAVNFFIDSIKVTTENRQKSLIFTVPNSLIWNFAIKIVASIPDPLHLTITEEDYKLSYDFFKSFELP